MAAVPGVEVISEFASAAARERVEETRRKRRILYGQHKADVTELLKEVIGNVRVEAWKAVDLSSNVALDAATARAVLYKTPPTHVHESPEFVAAVPPARGAFCQRPTTLPSVSRK